LDQNPSHLNLRTKNFALAIVMLVRSLPKTSEAQTIGKQIFRSGTSVGAQYREAIRARSRAEFQSKIESALQELEETGYWLNLLIDARILADKKFVALCKEQKELTAMFVASAKTVKQKTFTSRPLPEKG
jgi:four helix bundle protein